MSSNPSTTTAVAPSVFLLFSLPQELQDMVFDFAYPRVEGLSCVSRSSWKYHETFKKQEDRKRYVKRPFPPVKVNEFMVSKRFFVAASRAWVGNQHFNRLEHSVSLGRPDGITCAFARAATLHFLATGWAVDLLNLKVLHCEVTPVAFDECGDDIDVLENTLGDAELELVLQCSKLKDLRGLIEFEAVPGEYYSRNRTEEEHARYLDNVARFGRYARSRVTQPKSKQKSHLGFPASDADALYLGSAVRATSSKLVTIDNIWFAPRQTSDKPPHEEDDQLLSEMDWGTHQTEAEIESAAKLPHHFLPKKLIETHKSEAVEPEWISNLESPLKDEDIPITTERLQELVVWRGADVMAWLDEAKTSKRAACNMVKVTPPLDDSACVRAPSEAQAVTVRRAGGDGAESSPSDGSVRMKASKKRSFDTMMARQAGGQYVEQSSPNGSASMQTLTKTSPEPVPAIEKGGNSAESLPSDDSVRIEIPIKAPIETVAASSVDDNHGERSPSGNSARIQPLNTGAEVEIPKPASGSSAVSSPSDSGVPLEAPDKASLEAVMIGRAAGDCTKASSLYGSVCSKAPLDTPLEVMTVTPAAGDRLEPSPTDGSVCMHPAKSQKSPPSDGSVCVQTPAMAQVKAMTGGRAGGDRTKASILASKTRAQTRCKTWLKAIVGSMIILIMALMLMALLVRAVRDGCADFDALIWTRR